jgi:hypothetical protein
MYMGSNKNLASDVEIIGSHKLVGLLQPLLLAARTTQQRRDLKRLNSQPAFVCVFRDSFLARGVLLGRVFG